MSIVILQISDKWKPNRNKFNICDPRKWDRTVKSLTYYTPNGSVSFFKDSWLQALSRVFIHADEGREVNTQR
ncbi:MAG: hypothetical protein ACLVE2_15205 [Bacteroides caccae]